MRAPREEDAAPIWELVHCTDALDLNSPYAYLLLCSHFSPAGIVATGSEGQILGFSLGYRLPEDQRTLFVWQIGVADQARGQGLGGRLLRSVFDRGALHAASGHGAAAHGAGVALEYLEATVTPSNIASRMLFTRFAESRSARISESVAFRSSSFPTLGDANAKPHEDEIRLRIGPIRSP